MKKTLILDAKDFHLLEEVIKKQLDDLCSRYQALLAERDEDEDAPVNLVLQDEIDDCEVKINALNKLYEKHFQNKE